MNAKNREKGEEDSAVMEKNMRNEAVKAGTSGNQAGAKAKQGQGDDDIGKPSLAALLGVTCETTVFNVLCSVQCYIVFTISWNIFLML